MKKSILGYGAAIFFMVFWSAQQVNACTYTSSCGEELSCGETSFCDGGTYDITGLYIPLSPGASGDYEDFLTGGHIVGVDQDSVTLTPANPISWGYVDLSFDWTIPANFTPATLVFEYWDLDLIHSGGEVDFYETAVFTFDNGGTIIIDKNSSVPDKTGIVEFDLLGGGYYDESGNFHVDLRLEAHLNNKTDWRTLYNTSECFSVSLTNEVAPVPEPATMLLFGAGLVGLAGVSIRRRKK